MTAAPLRPAVDSPASDPNVTGTGGTKLLLEREHECLDS